MQTLPEWMYINGTVYYYDEWKGSYPELDWVFCCGLFPKKGGYGIPPYVKLNNGSSVYLCSAELNMEDARKNLLERINNMSYESNNNKENISS